MRNFPNSLLPEILDNRDLRPEMLGGIWKDTELPKKSFRIGEALQVRSQGSDMTCTTRMKMSMLERTEKVPLKDEWDWMKTAVLLKKSPEEINRTGVTLRDAFKTPVKVGALEEQYSVMDFNKDGRVECTKPERYDLSLDHNALIHKQASYFKADNRMGDRFDSILLSLWQNKRYDRTVGAGVYWHWQWSDSKDGVVEKISGERGSGHAIEIEGYEKLPSGKEYLVILNSGGKDVGDNGRFYFPRDVINESANLGAKMFVDCTEKQIKRLLNPPWYSRWFRIFN